MKRKRGYNMSRIFITGDTHGSYDIQKLARKNFPEGKTLTKDDYVIICGDFGCVWGGELAGSDRWWQNWLDEQPWTTLWVDGNHENHDLLKTYPIENWNGGLVVQDGMYLASESTVNLSVQSRKSLSSAVAGNEGLFNLKLKGSGTVVLESNVVREQLIEIELDDDVLKIDGNQAICWSGSLDFTVERSGKTLLGSAVSGEGLVNVFRGTGRVLLSPLDDSSSLYAATNTKNIKSE